jgi:hypothetical protein
MEFWSNRVCWDWLPHVVRIMGPRRDRNRVFRLFGDVHVSGLAVFKYTNTPLLQHSTDVC